MRVAANSVRASRNHTHVCGTTCVVVSSLSWFPMHTCEAMLSVERLPIPVHSRSGDPLIVSRKFSLPLWGGYQDVVQSIARRISSVHDVGD